MESKDFNQALDKYLTTSKLTSEEYESMTPEQQIFIQTLKRAFKRIQSKL